MHYVSPTLRDDVEQRGQRVNRQTQIYNVTFDVFGGTICYIEWRSFNTTSHIFYDSALCMHFICITQCIQRIHSTLYACISIDETIARYIIINPLLNCLSFYIQKAELECLIRLNYRRLCYGRLHDTLSVTVRSCVCSRHVNAATTVVTGDLVSSMNYCWCCHRCIT